MAKFPTYEDMSKKVAEKTLDEFLYDGKSIREWMQIIASEDAISRQEVLEQMNCWIGSGEYRYTNATDYLRKRINSLSPVAPKQKTGHWIKEKSMLGWDGNSYQCSECGRSIHLDSEVENLSDYPYCHCGAKMVKPQEEVKE